MAPSDVWLDTTAIQLIQGSLPSVESIRLHMSTHVLHVGPKCTHGMLASCSVICLIPCVNKSQHQLNVKA